MRILAVVSGEYGRRHVENIRKYGPEEWVINIWEPPATFPLVIDYPEAHLPESLPETDIVLAFAEHKGAAELLPDIARMTGAKAVIAPVDNEAWLPRGLARQLREWLERMNGCCVTPKPLCSLTEKDYLQTRRKRVRYENVFISEFAKHFGKPEFKIEVDESSRTIISAAVVRDAVCGCARYAAENLIGISIDEVEEKAGLLHHHYPCMASMGIDVDFNDTLMHVSGNILRDEVAKQIEVYKEVRYIQPGVRSEETGVGE